MSNETKPDVTVGVETFCEAGEKSMHLFRVTPGVPFDDAYEQVSVLLGYIKHLVHEGDMENDHKLLGAANYLSAFAKAIMDDIGDCQNQVALAESVLISPCDRADKNHTGALSHDLTNLTKDVRAIIVKPPPTRQ